MNRTGPLDRAGQVTAITQVGLYAETDESKAKGNKPQLIPVSTFTLAWEYLRAHGRLTGAATRRDDEAER